MGLLPLIPGCKAVITKGSRMGDEVICITHLGKPDPKAFNARADYDCWEIDTPVPWVNQNDGTTLLINIFPTKFLMRIDGFDTLKDNDAIIERAKEAVE